jgi:hypothetical protein
LTIKFTRRSRKPAFSRQHSAFSQNRTGKPRESTALDLLLAPSLWPRPPKDGSQTGHTSRSFGTQKIYSAL